MNLPLSYWLDKVKYNSVLAVLLFIIVICLSISPSLSSPIEEIFGDWYTGGDSTPLKIRHIDGEFNTTSWAFYYEFTQLRYDSSKVIMCNFSGLDGVEDDEKEIKYFCHEFVFRGENDMVFREITRYVGGGSHITFPILFSKIAD